MTTISTTHHTIEIGKLCFCIALYIPLLQYVSGDVVLLLQSRVQVVRVSFAVLVTGEEQGHVLLRLQVADAGGAAAELPGSLPLLPPPPPLLLLLRLPLLVSLPLPDALLGLMVMAVQLVAAVVVMIAVQVMVAEMAEDGVVEASSVGGGTGETVLTLF